MKKTTKLKKEKRTEITKNILLSFLVVIIFAIWSFISLFAAYDNFISGFFNIILGILAFFMIMLLIWKEKFRNMKMIILIILTILVRIGHGYYYNELSMKIEPLIYLQVKYGLKREAVKRSSLSRHRRGYLVRRGCPKLVRMYLSRSAEMYGKHT